MSSIEPRRIHLNIFFFPFYDFLAPETDIMVKFLEPETDVMFQFLAPEIVIMGKRKFMISDMRAEKFLRARTSISMRGNYD